MGKRNFITVGYTLPVGRINDPLPVLNNYNEVAACFNGQGKRGLGAKYGFNLSIADAQANLIVTPQYKISLDWNIFDMEIAAFDWSNNTFIRNDNPTGDVLTTFHSVKGGTRIGPAFTYMLNEDVAMSIYYNARPGIQFILNSMRINPSTTTSYTIEPERVTYNFSNEIGLKFHFNKVSLIPFYHFGAYTWKNNIQDVSTGSVTSEQQVQANYPFSYVGLRVGLF